MAGSMISEVLGTSLPPTEEAQQDSKTALESGKSEEETCCRVERTKWPMSSCWPSLDPKIPRKAALPSIIDVFPTPQLGKPLRTASIFLSALLFDEFLSTCLSWQQRACEMKLLSLHKKIHHVCL